VPLDDSKKRDVISNITTLLRQTKLAGNVDMQRMGLAFSMVLDNVDAGEPIDLQSLYDWLTREAKVDERAVVEMCVVLKAREHRLGVEFKVPAKLQSLSADVVEKILDKFNAGAGKSATWDRKDTAKSPGPSSPGFVPGKKTPVKRIAGADPRMLVVLGVLLVAMIGWYAYYLGTKTPPLQEVKLTDSSGLPCTSLKVNTKTAFCEIPAELYNKEGEALRARAEITKAELKRTRGVESLWVMTVPDHKTRFTL
jgi:hypothetical protein